jgi:23S rRNA (uracil1939-C5)-methyltransferase
MFVYHVGQFCNGKNGMISRMDCQHFGICGGCRSQPGSRPIPYQQELLQKETLVKTLLAPYEVGEWKPMIPSPEEWYYRNKMEYAFAVWDEHLVLGLREAGRFDHIIDLETCLLMSEGSLEVLKRTRQWANAKGLKGFHRRRMEGDLRYLVLREGKNTGERMAILVAHHTVDTAALTESIRPLLTTAWLGVTDAISDVARAEDMRLLWGPGTITEKINQRTYQISPYSFFQTNTRGTEKLYALLQEWGSSFRGALLDLYCGSGGIALALADSFDRVVGIDNNKDAIEDAKMNAERNGLGNTEFVCEDAMEFLKKLPGSKLSIQLSALVVDPPRAGLHPKALECLLDINPPRLAYVSCNPESLARDLQKLIPFYRIQSAQPVDLFPHTAHVETVVFMEHR